MTILLVTGVAYKQDKEVYRKRIEQFYGEKTILFDPEPYMEKSWLQKLLGWNKFLNMAADVINYWGKFPGSTRHEINKHYQRCVSKYGPNRIIAHSLGTVIVASNAEKYWSGSIYCLASPLWMPRIWRDNALAWAQLRFRVCLYSTRDWIALRGLWSGENYRSYRRIGRYQADVDCAHDLHHYLDYLFSEHDYIHGFHASRALS